METYDKDKIEKIIEYVGNDSTFNTYYQAMLKILKDDPFLDYDYIFKELLDTKLPLDIKSILSDEYQEIEKKIFLNQFFISAFSKAMVGIYRRKGGVNILLKSL